jgi:hypothetical protein
VCSQVHQNILLPIQVSPKQEKKSYPHSNGFLHALSARLCFVSQVLCQGSVDMPALLVEVTRA